VAPPPPDGSTGCVATIRRLMLGVGHTVPCGTARQALHARVGGLGGHWERYNVTSLHRILHRSQSSRGGGKELEILDSMWYSGAVSTP
jgi:hypothetical protein